VGQASDKAALSHFQKFFGPAPPAPGFFCSSCAIVRGVALLLGIERAAEKLANGGATIGDFRLASTPVFHCVEDWADQTNLNCVVRGILMAHIDLAAVPTAARSYTCGGDGL
jgi:hypothetical protein